LENKLQQLTAQLEQMTHWTELATFQQSFELYAAGLLEHLQNEEELVLPMIRAFYSQADFKEMGKRMGKEGGHAGSFVYYMGEDKFRHQFMPNHHVPSFVWYVAFSRALQEYKYQVIRHLEALEKNVGPPPDESCVVS